MKQTIGFNEFRDAFRAYDRLENFSRQGLELLFDYCEESDPDMELDVIALCCEYSEESAEDIASSYSIDISHVDNEDDDYEEQVFEAVRDYLEDNTTVVGEVAGGFVYAVF
jgi:hypothetical protein